MILAVMAGFVLSIAAPFIHRAARGFAGWVFAVFPLLLFLQLGTFVGPVGRGETILFSVSWIPSLGVGFSFYLDGLSLLFGLLITGVGVLVFVYTNTYLAGHPQLGRFYGFMLLFMSSMLGLVFADNMLVLFVFWELTSISSYLLIGFDHERAEARKASLQALLVTSTGGLALLTGFLLMESIAGTQELSKLSLLGATVRSHPLYTAVLLLVLGGAFTKSAQFPFHFWLPNAMEAPTPVSTYLHSATMVKAGIYLIARLSPVLGGTKSWVIIVMGAGAITMILGAWLAVGQTDMKKILAYSTTSVLGALTFLLGMGSRAALDAAVTYLVIHALYKAALFLVAGIVDHEAGTRDVSRLGGLASAMPITAVAAGLASLSMAGLPPFFGFIGKELIYAATEEAPLLTMVALLTSIGMVVIAGIIGLKPFWGSRNHAIKTIHEPPPALWLGPLILASMGLLIGIFPGFMGGAIVSPAVAAILLQPVAVKLALLHGLTLQLILSGIGFVAGIFLYLNLARLRRAVTRLDFGARFGPSRGYSLAEKGMNLLAFLQTRLLQSGHLHFYLLTILLTAVGLLSSSFFQEPIHLGLDRLSDLHVHEGLIAAVMAVAVIAAVRARNLILAIVALGTIGYSMAMIYILFGAPDLAMTQFAVDTLIVFLIVLAIRDLPEYVTYSTGLERFRDLLPAIAFGGLISLLTLTATATPKDLGLASYFGENSYLLARGRNVVNVILVDFRAFDTLGEITVLAVAAIGVYSLVKLRSRAQTPAPPGMSEFGGDTTISSPKPENGGKV
jgi:multicomponent Na+:H+ antiporter subunit A